MEVRLCRRTKEDMQVRGAGFRIVAEDLRPSTVFIFQEKRRGRRREVVMKATTSRCDSFLKRGSRGEICSKSRV